MMTLINYQGSIYTYLTTQRLNTFSATEFDIMKPVNQSYGFPPLD